MSRIGQQDGGGSPIRLLPTPNGSPGFLSMRHLEISPETNKGGNEGLWLGSNNNGRPANTEQKGMGMTFTLPENPRGAHPVVAKVAEGGGASQAGIKRGDRLLSIDGSNVKGWSLAKVQRSILDGEPGSLLKLELERGTSGRRLAVAVPRVQPEQSHDLSRSSVSVPILHEEAREQAEAKTLKHNREKEESQSKINQLSFECTRLKTEAEEYRNLQKREAVKHTSMQRELERAMARAEAAEEEGRRAATREAQLQQKCTDLAAKLAKLSAKEEQSREAERRAQAAAAQVTAEERARAERVKTEMQGMVELWKGQDEQERKRREKAEEALATERAKHMQLEQDLSLVRRNAAQFESDCRNLQEEASRAAAALADIEQLLASPLRLTPQVASLQHLTQASSLPASQAIGGMALSNRIARACVTLRQERDQSVDMLNELQRRHMQATAEKATLRERAHSMINPISELIARVAEAKAMLQMEGSVLMHDRREAQAAESLSAMLRISEESIRDTKDRLAQAETRAAQAHAHAEDLSRQLQNAEERRSLEAQVFQAQVREQSGIIEGLRDKLADAAVKSDRDEGLIAEAELKCETSTREARQLAVSLSEAEERLSGSMAKVQGLQEELERVYAQLLVAESEREAWSKRDKAVQAERDEWVVERERLRRQIHELQEANEEARREREQAREQIEEGASQIANCNMKLAAERQQLADAQRAKGLVEQDLDEASEALHRMEEEKQSVERNARAQLDDIQHLRSENARLNSHVEDLKALLSVSNQSKADEAQVSADRIDDLLGEGEELTRQVTKLQQSLAQANDSVQSREEKALATQAELGKLQQQFNELQYQLKEGQSERERMRQLMDAEAKHAGELERLVLKAQEDTKKEVVRLLEERIAVLEKSLDTTKQELVERTQTCGEQEVLIAEAKRDEESLRETCDKLQRKYDKHKAAANRLKGVEEECTRLAQELEALGERHQELDRVRNALEDRLAESSAQEDKLARQIQQLEMALGHQSQSAEKALQERNVVQAKLSDMEQEVGHLQAEVHHARVELERAGQEAGHIINESNATLAAEMKQSMHLRRELEDCRRTIAVMEGELVQLRATHESLVHAADTLGSSLESTRNDSDIATILTGDVQIGLAASCRQLETDLRKMAADFEEALPSRHVQAAASRFVPAITHSSHAEARALAALGSATERFIAMRTLLAERDERIILLNERAVEADSAAAEANKAREAAQHEIVRLREELQSACTLSDRLGTEERQAREETAIKEAQLASALQQGKQAEAKQLEVHRNAERTEMEAARRLAGVQGELAVALRSADEAKKERTEVQFALQKAVTACEVANVEVANMKQRLHDKGEDMKNAEAKREESERREKELAAEVGRLKQRMEDIQALHRAQMEAADKELNSLNLHILEMTKVAEANREEIVRLDKSKGILEEQLARERDQAVRVEEDAIRACTDLQAEASEAKDGRSAVAFQLEEQERVLSQTKDALKKLKKEHKRVLMRNQELELKMEEMDGNDARAKSDKLEERLAEVFAERDAVTAALSSEKDARREEAMRSLGLLEQAREQSRAGEAAALRLQLQIEAMESEQAIINRVSEGSDMEETRIKKALGSLLQRMYARDESVEGIQSSATPSSTVDTTAGVGWVKLLEGIEDIADKHTAKCRGEAAKVKELNQELARISCLYEETRKALIEATEQVSSQLNKERLQGKDKQETLRDEILQLEGEASLWRLHQQTLRVSIDRLLSLAAAPDRPILLANTSSPNQSRPELSPQRSFTMRTSSALARTWGNNQELQELLIQDERDAATAVEFVLRTRDKLRLHEGVSMEERADGLARHEAAVEVLLDRIECLTSAVMNAFGSVQQKSADVPQVRRQLEEALLVNRRLSDLQESTVRQVDEQTLALQQASMQRAQLDEQILHVKKALAESEISNELYEKHIIQAESALSNALQVMVKAEVQVCRAEEERRVFAERVGGMERMEKELQQWRERAAQLDEAVQVETARRTTLQDDLASAQAHVTALHEHVQQEQQRVSQLNQECEELRERLVHMVELVALYEKNQEAASQHLDQIAKVAQRLEVSLADSLQESRCLKGELRQAQKDNAEKDAQIADKNLQIADQSIAIANKDAQIADQDAQIANKDAQIADQSVQIANKDAQIADQSAQIASKDAQLVDQNAQMADKDAEVFAAISNCKLAAEESLRAQEELESRLNISQFALEATESEKNRVQELLGKSKGETFEVQTALDDAVAKEQVLRIELEQLEEEASKLREQVPLLNERVAKMQSMFDQGQEQLHMVANNGQQEVQKMSEQASKFQSMVQCMLDDMDKVMDHVLLIMHKTDAQAAAGATTTKILVEKCLSASHSMHTLLHDTEVAARQLACGRLQAETSMKECQMLLDCEESKQLQLREAYANESARSEALVSAIAALEAKVKEKAAECERLELQEDMCKVQAEKQYSDLVNAAADVESIQTALLKTQSFAGGYLSRIESSMNGLDAKCRHIEGILHQVRTACMDAVESVVRSESNLKQCVLQLEYAEQQTLAAQEIAQQQQQQHKELSDEMGQLTARCEDLTLQMEESLKRHKQQARDAKLEYAVRNGAMLQELAGVKLELAKTKAESSRLMEIEQSRRDVEAAKSDAQQRLQQAMSSVEERVVKERDAREAAEQRVRDLDDSIRQCEAAAAANDKVICMLEERVSALGATCMQRDRENRALEDKLCACESKAALEEREWAMFRQQNSEEIDGLMREFEDLREQLVRADAVKETLHAQVMEGMQSSFGVERGLRDIDQLMFSIVDALVKAEVQVCRAEEERRVFAERVGGMERMEKELQQWRERAAQLDEAVQVETARRTTLQDDLASAQAHVTALHEHVQQEQQRVSQVQQEAEEWKNKTSAVEAEVEAKQRLLVLCEDQMQQLHGFMLAHEVDKKQLLQSLEESRAGKQELEAKVEALQIEGRRMSSLAASANRKLAVSESAARDLSQVIERLESALAAVEPLLLAATQHCEHDRQQLVHTTTRLEGISNDIEKFLVNCCAVARGEMAGEHLREDQLRRAEFALTAQVEALQVLQARCRELEEEVQEAHKAALAACIDKCDSREHDVQHDDSSETQHWRQCTSEIVQAARELGLREGRQDDAMHPFSGVSLQLATNRGAGLEASLSHKDAGLLAQVLDKWGVSGGSQAAGILEGSEGGDGVQQMMQGECMLLRVALSQVDDMLSSLLDTLQHALMHATKIPRLIMTVERLCGLLDQAKAREEHAFAVADDRDRALMQATSGLQQLEIMCEAKQRLAAVLEDKALAAQVIAGQRDQELATLSLEAMELRKERTRDKSALSECMSALSSLTQRYDNLVVQDACNKEAAARQLRVIDRLESELRGFEDQMVVILAEGQRNRALLGVFQEEKEKMARELEAEQHLSFVMQSQVASLEEAVRQHVTGKKHLTITSD